ncbi:Bug family tripartite tricarboxylate transporter substrate binding protein [Chelativorans salis]|uniref:Tripartite tricarboxylate transporter substrate binding protein n=1 Tax=Chelativorans salis TaxID=2978478 RepID=A0ABT2LUF2_9HYPH|nr:tripartite tricarboxylate transporter substrate binding protein [Chelativorans sp. EGI FJ00035]MCT7378142.1 tripartite tricarboxylate transporter substrate binding protein [Chelativorans sp. EGI FJ00035]
MARSENIVRAMILGLGLSVSYGTVAVAQSYPEQPITFVVGFSAGGFADTMARIIADGVSRELGQPVVVENQGGAGGDIAAARVAAADPDGYTVLVTTASFALSEALGAQREYQVSDLAPVAVPVSSPETLAAHPSVPVKNLAELIEWAKTQEDVTFGHAGIGTGSQVTMSYFLKQLAELDNVIEVTYSGGGPANQAAISGEVQLVASSNSVYPFIREGLLTGLGIAANTPHDAVPGVGTFTEQGYEGFVVSSWVGLLVPAATDPGIQATLNAAVNTVLGDPDARARFADAGVVVHERDLPAVQQFMQTDIELWREMVSATQ